MKMINLHDWDCAVGLNEQKVLVCSLIDSDEPPNRVEVVCEHFLEAVNEALSTNYKIYQFSEVSCEGHA